MGEVFTAQLQVDFGTVVVLVHLDGDEVDALCIGDGAGAAVLVAVHVARTALDEHVAQHDRRVVAVGGLARNSVGFGAGERKSEHRHEEDERDGAHGWMGSAGLIKG